MNHNGHDQHNGRFVAGNPGGPGRPPRPVEQDRLRALTDGVSPEAWQAIIRRAVEDAQGGDPKARDWLGRYLLGDPERLQEMLQSRPLLAIQFVDAPPRADLPAELQGP